MDMSQYRALFLSEAREHLDQMNQLVVALEREPGDTEAVNALFREAHSIKGMAATMGFEQTAQLAHQLEDTLDHCRKSGGLPVAVADRLLDAIDLLEGLVDDIAADLPERDISAFLADVVEPAVLAVAPKDPPDLPLDALIEIDEELVLTPVEEEDIEVLPETEVFQISVTLAPDVAMPAARGLLLLRELGKHGEIVSSTPDKDALLTGQVFEQISAWFRTSLQRDHVRELLLAFPDAAEVVFVEDRRSPKSTPGAEAARTVRVRTDLLDRFVNLAGELITQRHVLQSCARERDWTTLDPALERTERLVRDLHHHVLRTRLMPLETIAGRLPRIVRDLGRKTGKRVTFHLIGGEVGLDRVILDELADPLVHLVRNAVDHGIRDCGEVIVKARRERDLVLVEVSDDGVGMDPATLRAKAVQKGLLTQTQADALSEREALLLVCRPGFSTAAEVTETSGRGVGMDVVKAAVENLGGNLEIDSAPGQGTCFRLKLPLSIAIIKLVLVRCAGLPVALPVTRVQRIIEIPRNQVESQEGVLFFSLDGARVPVVPLAGLLGRLGQSADPVGPETCIVLTEWQGAPLGLQVDGFIGHRDAFVKNLGFPFDQMVGLSGATIEGDGSVLFVVDPQPLLAAWSTDVQTGTGETMPFQQLSEIQRDAFKEVSNIGMGHAATALSQLVGKRIEIYVPRVLVLPLAEVPERLGGAEKLMAGIVLRIEGETPGSIMLLFPEESACRLCSALLGEEVTSLETQETVSTLKEVGNILSSAYLNALGSLIGKTLLPSIPGFAYDMAGALVDALLIDLGRQGELALMVETEFGGELGQGHKVRGHFFLIPDPETFESFLQEAQI